MSTIITEVQEFISQVSDQMIYATQIRGDDQKLFSGYQCRWCWQYAQDRETIPHEPNCPLSRASSFTPAIEQLAQTARTQAIQECVQFLNERASEIDAGGNVTSSTMARIYRDEAVLLGKHLAEQAPT